LVQFAKRLDSIPPYLFGEIARMKAKALADGADLIDFGNGDPDQPTPQAIIDKLAEAANNPATHRYDESDFGWPEYIDAIAGWYKKRFGVSLDTSKGEVLELIGSKEGLAHLAWAYIDQGDISLVPEPGYTVYKVNTLMAGGTPHVMPLLPENGYLPDLSAIPSDVAAKARLMYLNYPNNPTSAVATKEFFSDVVAFAKQHDIIVCHDAAYSEVCYDGYQAPSFLEVPGAMDVAIEINSLSKAYNMAGWRVAWAAGNRDIIKGLNKMKANIDSKQFPGLMMAAAHALRNMAGDPRTIALYQKRRDILIDALNSLGWNLPKTQATLYIWAPVPPGYTSIEFAKLMLEKCGVLIIPGVGYGPYGEGYFRMSLTVSGDKDGERITEAVRRMKANLEINW
jgi:LL-diaminopimelate aminotransferase